MCMTYIRRIFAKTEKLLQFAVVPTIIYFLFCLVFFFPLLKQFNSSFLGDSQDVYQNVWSLWWFAQAVDNPELELWHTNLVYYPQGESLYGHALSPLNGALAYPLQKFLPWVQVYNTLIIFNFVVTGLSMFGLAYSYTKAKFPSLVAGAFYTFSAYHLMHSRGHIEMAAMQWLTFYLLSFIWMLDKPSAKKALVCALLLLLVLLNTPYHLLYAFLLCSILGAFYLGQKRNNKTEIKKIVRVLLQFGIISAALLGPLLLQYSYHNAVHHFVGAHDPREHSAELFNYFAQPDGVLGEWTDMLWPEILASPGFDENQVRLSVVALVLVSIGLKTKDKRRATKRVWLAVGLIFLVLSLGPIVQYQGYPITRNNLWVYVPLPYALAEQMLPPLKLSGVPARMALVPVMSVSLLAAFGIQTLLEHKKYGLICLLLGFAFVESVPRAIAPLNAKPPESVLQLAALPAGGLLDVAHDQAQALYYQVFHHKPLTTGYLSRISLANSKKLGSLMHAQEMHNLWLLCATHQVRYLWVAEAIPGREPIAAETGAYLYDLKPDKTCLGAN